MKLTKDIDQITRIRFINKSLTYYDVYEIRTSQTLEESPEMINIECRDAVECWEIFSEIENINNIPISHSSDSDTIITLYFKPKPAKDYQSLG